MTPQVVARIALAVSILLPQIARLNNKGDLLDEPPLSHCDDDDPYNGYRWSINPDLCVPGLPTIESWFTPAPPYTVGASVWYNPRLMEATAEFRGMSLEGFVDGVSLMSPSDIGRTVWLRRPDHDWEGPFLVVDCARRGDIWPVIMYNGEIVEVGFQTAVKWGLVEARQYRNGEYGRPFKVKHWRLDGVEVIKMDVIPPWINEYEPIDFKSWWGDRVTFSNGYDIPAPQVLHKDYYPEHHPGWLWRAGDEPFPLTAYDDWFSLMFPDDPRYEFELPQNYTASDWIDEWIAFYRWRFIIEVFDSPGFNELESGGMIQ